MDKFLSCDWGTSAFRLRLVNTTGLDVVAEEATQDGIAAVYALWKESGKDRFSFFLGIVKGAIASLEKKLNISLQGTPICMSGMVSASIGMLELRYKNLPFSLNGSDLVVETMPSNSEFNHKMILVSGIQSGDDVMRGEETHLIGCLFDNAEGETLFILPGTHSKHIRVKEGLAIGFETYMTGEFFELLSTKSILATSIEEDTGMKVTTTKKSFEEGVRKGIGENLLHASFLVRTNQLFDKVTRQENYSFLSGLLIGTELKEVVTRQYQKIILVGNEKLLLHYQVAFGVLASLHLLPIVQTINADLAVIRGQYKILKEHSKHSA